MRRMWFALSTAGLIVSGASALAFADVGRTIVDKQEEHQIRTQLHKAPDLRDNRIDVHVDDGIAVLEGTVDSKQEKKEAQQLAHVDGILGVNNRLEVRAAGK